MSGCKLVETPIAQSHKLNEGKGSTPMNKEINQHLVEKLIYLAHTRSNIAYVVSVVSQFMHDPREMHMEAVFRVPKYLKSSSGQGIYFKRRGSLILEAYMDANWVGSIIERRSTSRYCTFLGGNLVTWRSKKAIGSSKV